MPSYMVKTFGCQMNVHDSQRIREVLQTAGYGPADSQDAADVIVVNTCSVREKAEQKLRSLVGTLAALKASRPDLIVVVAGCVAQQYGKRLLGRAPWIDLVVGPDNIPELPSLIEAAGHGATRTARTVLDVDAPVFLKARPDIGGGSPSEFVTIMKGCDERCSFCIVPFTRGSERYRPSSEITDEVRRLCAAGVREVTLLGQTVNSYADPSGVLRASGPDPGSADESAFPSLLHEIAARVPQLERLRYTSPHPRHVTAALVAAHHDLDVIARHVHLPVQSGSDRVLKRMIRRYTRSEYVDRTLALQASRPDFTVSTDIIVGFPGETERDFLDTLDLVKEVRFRGVFGFKYSPRPHTPAQNLPDDVPETEKSARLTALFALSEAAMQEHLDSLVGSVQRVLIEGPSKTGPSSSVTGRTDRNEIVHIADPPAQPLVGQIVRVRITLAHKHSLDANLGDGGDPPLRSRSLPVFPG
jgi:tRNA-2-methylthio-N6-dimethylallyladenosine synthase